MAGGKSVVFLVGFCMVSFFIAFTSCIEKWNMHERCGQRLEGYGGEIFFDSRRLPFNTATCTVTIVGNGTEDYMLSLYFTSYNVSSDCMANITLREEGQNDKGLYQSFCASNPYLNDNLIYTTNGRILSLVYTRRVSKKPVTMAFNIKYVTFVSRVSGCTKDEVEHQNMFSCRTGRCVHESLVCQDLNPCGDHRDCIKDGGKSDEEEGKGLSFVKIVILVVVTVFVVFAIIQVCLIVRNEHGMCSWKDPKVRLDVEFMTVYDVDIKKAGNPEKTREKPGNPEKTLEKRAEERDSGTASDKETASDSLITREPA